MKKEFFNRNFFAGVGALLVAIVIAFFLLAPKGTITLLQKGDVISLVNDHSDVIQFVIENDSFLVANKATIMKMGRTVLGNADFKKIINENSDAIFSLIDEEDAWMLGYYLRNRTDFIIAEKSFIPDLIAGHDQAIKKLTQLDWKSMPDSVNTLPKLESFLGNIAGNVLSVQLDQTNDPGFIFKTQADSTVNFKFGTEAPVWKLANSEFLVLNQNSNKGLFPLPRKHAETDSVAISGLWYASVN
ncbi:hypothetical protein HN954_00425 [bacterium]|jgi:hypothetical protein|nr:hypothetical protein [bacterium]MBT6832098.1 hypothetical protein [bacterium]MBT6995879.1 hypothetical protein [bacterium]MBT7772596.1 hypothetical protein [bacterium]